MLILCNVAVILMILGAMDLNQIDEWSRQMQVSPPHCVVLSGVPLTVTDETINEVLSTVKAFGRTKICGRRGDTTGLNLFLLIETSLEVDSTIVPPEVGIPGVVEPWRVHIPGKACAPGDAFHEKLMCLLQQEGKSLCDVRSIVNPEQSPIPNPAVNVNLDLVQAINSLVEKCTNVPGDTVSYRKLRVFSGIQPTPPGEEDYDSWMEQAAQMVSEWQCADSIKRQRIVESLRGPAADIIRFLKVSSPAVTATEYLMALDTAYGSTESQSDLLVRFSNTYQEPGEKLSLFLCRLDKLLHRIFLKKGIKVEELNQKRMEQVVKGALTTDMVALRLRMTHKLRDPPSFSELLREVREEESWVSAREKSKILVSSAVVAQETPSHELADLKRDVQELSAQVGKLLTAVAETSAAVPVTQKAVARAALNANDREGNQKKDVGRYNPSAIFCYKCGEDGHTKRECKGVEDLRKVNQKLIRQNRQSGNARGAL
ncbi:paraneoplastic antigen Ma1 homolog [Paramisgurnus dabryanus]|uniref:paraneoplastic antigen Ma1 homolog n=1 Tax=Paramisgurnus dabryanus TaxID=90735 RepID=UPI0031F381FE